MTRTILFLLFLALATHCTSAQEITRIDSGKSVATQVSDTGFVMAKSPLGAVIRSAILPGWGQWYNESYWKIPIVIGLSAWMIRGIIVENSSYNTYSTLYAASITTANPAGN